MYFGVLVNKQISATLIPSMLTLAIGEVEELVRLDFLHGLHFVDAFVHILFMLIGSI